MRRRKLGRAPRHEDAGRERTCIATGEVLPPEKLVRFVLSPDGVVVADLAGKLPGRGAWTRVSREAVAKAASIGLFARAFKRAARLPEDASAQDFAASVGAGLEKRALDALGLARRSGKLVLGFDQAARALKENEIAALIVAANASVDGREKFARLASGRPMVASFSSGALSQALGRENVTYAALFGGSEASRFLSEAERYAEFAAPASIEGAPCGAIT